MGMDVMGVLRKAAWMRGQVERVEECLEELSVEERMILDCLLENEDGKIMAVCMELDVSERTAYRYIDRVKHRISELFDQKGVTIL